MYKVSTYIKLSDGAFWSEDEIMSKEEALQYLEHNIDRINSNYHIVVSAGDFVKQANSEIITQ